MKNCVYRIINKINNKVYIGSTIDSERREIEHFSQLENNIHINIHLQNAYNKYGKDAFIFDVIESDLDNGELLKREQHYINLFNASNRNFGYNISSYANQPDSRKYTKIYIAKLKDILKKKLLSTSTMALFLCLQIYIEKYTNRIAKENGKRFTNKELQKISGLSSVPLKNALNKLENNNIIKRIGAGKAREIYFNPYIITAGYEIQQEIYNMFK